MSQPSIAARRFYRAFYCWTVTTRSSHSHPRRTPHRNARLYHRSAAHFQNAVRSQDAPSKSPGPLGPLIVKSKASTLDEVQREWKAKQVQASNVLSFDSLSEWEEVLRYRSDVGVMVQIPVPAAAVAEMEKRFGEGLVGMQEQFGGRVEVGASSLRDDTKLRSVLLSGNWEAAAMTKLALDEFRLKAKSLPRARQGGSQSRLTSSEPAQPGNSTPATLQQGVGAVAFEQEEISSTSKSTEQKSMANPAFKSFLATHSRQDIRKGEPAYELWLRIPLQPRAEQRDRLFSALIGPKSVRVADVRDRSGAKVFVDYPNLTFIITGPKHHVLHAKYMLRVQFEKFCAQDKLKDTAMEEVIPLRQQEILETPTPGTTPSIDSFPWRKEPAYLLKLHIPTPPGGSKTTFGYVVGPNEQILQEIKALTGCVVNTESNNNLIFRGTRSAIFHARSMVEGKLIKVAGKNNTERVRPETIEPLRLLNEDELTELDHREAQVWQRHGLSEERVGLRAERERRSSGSDTVQRNEHGLKRNDSQPTRSSAPETKVADPQQQASQLSDTMKFFLRAMTHPAVVVTSRIRDPDVPKLLDAHMRLVTGVTVSSFTTVTLSPKPVISFNLKLPSRSWDAICSSKRLNVHILPATPEGAAVAHTFTKPYDDSGEPFRRLQQQGAHVMLDVHSTGVPNKPPRITWGERVVARIEASLMEDKCVRVEDHVIVVAEVLKVVSDPSWKSTAGQGFLEERGILSYSQRSYRTSGAGVQPLELSEKPSENQVVPERDEEVSEGGTALQKENLEEDDHSQDLSGQTEGCFEEAAQHTDDAADEKQGERSRHAVESGDTDKDKDAMRPWESGVVKEDYIENDARDEISILVKDESSSSTTGLVDEKSTEVDRRGQNVQDSGHSISDIGTEPESISRVSGSSSSHSGPRRGSQFAWGVKPVLKSSFSTMSSTAKRRYSTTTTMTSDELNSNNQDLTCYVSEPDLLSTKVGDFLGIDSPYFIPPPRIRGLMRARRDSERAARRLEEGLASGTIDVEESRALEGTITRNDHHITKTLALRSVKNLKRMLDRGRVDARRVPWLESSVERGQLVLLEEAKLLRKLVDQGRVEGEQLERWKRKLQEENQLLSDEARRLRQMVADEGEEGISSVEEGRKQFFDSTRMGSPRREP